MGEEAFRIPLVGPYGIYRDDPTLKSDHLAHYSLVKAMDGAHTVVSAGVVDGLKKAAVSGRIIVGSTEKGFFIFDTAEPDARPRLFDNAEEWRAALRAANVPADIQLSEPDVLGAALPYWQTHPVACMTMKGACGMIDGEWGGLTIVTGMVIIFVRSLLVSSRTSPGGWAVVLGVIVGIADTFLNTDTPLACGGIVMFPIAYWIIGQVVRLLRELVWERWLRGWIHRPLPEV